MDPSDSSLWREHSKNRPKVSTEHLKKKSSSRGTTFDSVSKANRNGASKGEFRRLELQHQREGKFTRRKRRRRRRNTKQQPSISTAQSVPIAHKPGSEKHRQTANSAHLSSSSIRKAVSMQARQGVNIVTLPLSGRQS